MGGSGQAFILKYPLWKCRPGQGLSTIERYDCVLHTSTIESRKRALLSAHAFPKGFEQLVVANYPGSPLPRHGCCCPPTRKVVNIGEIPSCPGGSQQQGHYNSKRFAAHQSTTITMSMSAGMEENGDDGVVPGRVRQKFGKACNSLHQRQSQARVVAIAVPSS